MVKVSYTKLKGSQNIRLRLLLSTLSSTPILIEDIRADATWPGLRPHEVSFLRLLEKISGDCVVEINKTGTKFKYKPGIVMGGRHLVHDCGVTRAMGYFLEPLIVLGLFGKKPLSIKLQGIDDVNKIMINGMLSLGYENPKLASYLLISRECYFWYTLEKLEKKNYNIMLSQRLKCSTSLSPLDTLWVWDWPILANGRRGGLSLGGI